MPEPASRLIPYRSTGAPQKAGELAALFERWQINGDQRAREQLVTRFMPLARKLARRYMSANEPMEDLVQVASLALVKAVDRYDPSRGTSFLSFAVPTILGELKRYFRDAGWAVHVPRARQEQALRVEKATQAMIADAGRLPSVHQLAQYLEWELGEVLDALEANGAHHASSLDAPRRSEDADDTTLIETLGSDDPRFDLAVDRLAVKASVRKLPMVERRVVYLCFIEGLKQQDVADRIGVSQMQVSRLLASALRRLREHADASPGGR